MSGPAAVHDDRVQPDVLEQHDVAGELLAQRRVGHRRAAVLDDHRLAVELADVRAAPRAGCRRPSRRVLRVDGHVLVARGRRRRPRSRRPRRAGRRCTRPPSPRDGLRERGLVEGHGGAARADLHVLDPDVERQRRGAGQRGADGLGDAAPVGVAAVQRRLDQRRVGDGAGGGVDRRLVAAVDDDAADPARRPRRRARSAARAGAAARRAPRRSAARRRTRARPSRRSPRWPSGSTVSLVESWPSTRDAVEGALDAHAEQQVGRLGRERGVGLHEAQHRGEARARSSPRPWPGRSAGRCRTAA